MKLKRILALAAALVLAAGLARGEGQERVASQEERTDVIDLALDGAVPVLAGSLLEGTYGIQADVSSSMFKVVSCTLTVRDGEMTARLYMKSDAYSDLFAGSAEQAVLSAPEERIALSQDETGPFFDLPVPALDAPVEFAALSARKQAWYPRTLVLRSDSLPLSAFDPAKLATAASLGLRDGTYLCGVSLTGEGRARVQSPCEVTVQAGLARAQIVFSTSKIDYILAGGEKLLPLDTAGGASFLVPVPAFDRPLAVTVDSTAIVPATEVPYSLTFESASLTEK